MDCRNLHTVWIAPCYPACGSSCLDYQLLFCIDYCIPDTICFKGQCNEIFDPIVLLNKFYLGSFWKDSQFFPFLRRQTSKFAIFLRKRKISSNCFCLFTFSVHMGPIQSFFFRKASKSRDTLSLSCLVLNCCLVAFCFLFPLKLSLVTLLFCCVVVCGCHRPAPPPSPPALLTSVDLIPAPP